MPEVSQSETSAVNPKPRGSEPPSEIVRIGEHGPIFVLRDSLTAESVRASIEEMREHWLCRRLRHRWKVIGEPFFPEPTGDSNGELMLRMLALLSNSDTRDLVRCQRCGKVAVRGR